jgi:hypothetical protein
VATQGDVLARAMGCRFPPAFYERLKAAAPAPKAASLGGNAGDGGAEAILGGASALAASVGSLQGALFRGEAHFPHSLMVEALLPPPEKPAAGEAAASTDGEPRCLLGHAPALCSGLRVPV